MCRFTDDPKAYMKQFLEKLKDARSVQRNYPCIFDDSNVRSLFGMLDVTGKGVISYEQYKKGDLSYLHYSLTVYFPLQHWAIPFNVCTQTPLLPRYSGISTRDENVVTQTLYVCVTKPWSMCGDMIQDLVCLINFSICFLTLLSLNYNTLMSFECYPFQNSYKFQAHWHSSPLVNRL